MSNVTWCCFLTGSPCDKDDIEWDPTKVPVFLPTDYVKSDIVYEYGVRPAINDLGLSASRIRIQLKATSSHQAEPLFPDDQEHRGQELCRICRAAQEGLLTIADVTGGDPMVFLALGLIWGLGQPVILTHLDGAFAPIHTTRFESIPYTDPGDGEFGRQIKLAVQDKTKVTELSQENCIACGGGFGSSEAVIVCLNCRMRYHKQCWPQRCRECGGASYICL